MEGNLIKSLYFIKRDSMKEGDNVRRKLLRHKEMFDAMINDDAHFSLGHLKSSVTWREVKRFMFTISLYNT